MSKAENVFRNVLKESEMSTTVGMMGPSSSTKSTAQTLILQMNSNKLLSRNIGDTAQTSLIDTFIGLTSALDVDEVCIQCVPKKYGTDFQDAVLETVWTKMYELRDEIEEFETNDEMLKAILNPANKSFHAYEFVIDNEINLTELINSVQLLVQDIAEIPTNLNEAVEKEFKERKKIDKKPVKKDVFQKIVMERFFNCEEQLQKLENWYSLLLANIKECYGKYWTVPEEYIVYGNISQDTNIGNFISEVYADNSAFSMAFKSLRYVVRPNDEFIVAYKNRYGITDNRFKMSFNLLDTVGLTQTGDTKDIIENAIEENLGKKVDAFLFLCASDAKPTIYQFCMEALSSHSKRIENMPFTICRTKVDTILRNKMNNICRVETGINTIDDSDYGKYLKKAFDSFKEEQLTRYDFGENRFGDNSDNCNQPIEYVSMAPDLYEKMLGAYPELNGSNHIIQIIINLFYAVDKKYIDNNIMRVKSNDSTKIPISINMTREYFEGLAAAMVEENERGKNQYLQYINGCYHGYSITCFFSKHSRGVGHETHCRVYDDFKLYIKSMIRGWLTKHMIDKGEKSCKFDYENVFMVDKVDMIPFINEFENRFEEVLRSDIVNIIDRVAKRLSYDCFEDKFWECYNWKSRQTGFLDNLELFNSLFSSQEYWEENLEIAFKDEYARILSRMCDYIIEEV